MTITKKTITCLVKHGIKVENKVFFFLVQELNLYYVIGRVLGKKWSIDTRDSENELYIMSGVKWNNKVYTYGQIEQLTILWYDKSIEE